MLWRSSRPRVPPMPVDHPDKPLERRAPPAHLRKINLALGFLIALGLLFMLAPMFNIGGLMS
jgi:hypothetical protein